MDQQRAKELQGKLVQEAAAMLTLVGSEAEVSEYEQVITLVGKAWELPEKDTLEQLALIQKERETMRRIEKGEPAEHIMPEQDILLNWSGLESIEVIEDLFETTTLLDTQAARCIMFRMAMTLIECQNLLDWIEKTEEEKRVPELVEEGTPGEREGQRMRYFNKEQSALSPQTLLNTILKQALEVLDIGDASAGKMATLHKRGAEIVARESGISLKEQELFRQLEAYGQNDARSSEKEIAPLIRRDDGADTEKPLAILWSLFDLAALLDDAGERQDILDLAAYMMDYLDVEGNIRQRIPRLA